jgi:hypothetical protein
MAVYSLTISSSTALRDSIKASLTAAGILTTTHYETGDNLIVTTTRSNKVIRWATGNSRLQTYIGDTYTSGTTITNQVTINAPGSNSYVEANMVVTDKVFYIGMRTNTNESIHALFGRLDSATQEYVALGWTTNNANGAPVLRDTTNNTQAEATQLNRILISTSGYYYIHDLPVASNANVLLASAVQGVKSLQRAYVTGSQIVTYGDDVALSGGYANGATSYFPQSLLIEDGNSWEPA